MGGSTLTRKNKHEKNGDSRRGWPKETDGLTEGMKGPQTELQGAPLEEAEEVFVQTKVVAFHTNLVVEVTKTAR